MALCHAATLLVLFAIAVSGQEYERDLEKLQAELELEVRKLELEDNQGLESRQQKERDFNDEVAARQEKEFEYLEELASRQKKELEYNQGLAPRQEREFEYNEELTARRGKEFEYSEALVPRREREFEYNEAETRQARGYFDCRKNAETCSGFPACCGTLQCYWEDGYSVTTSGQCVPCVDRAQKCQRDGQCCQPLVCQKVTLYSVDGTCDVKRANRADCHKDIQCQAGYCDISWENLAKGQGGHCAPIPTAARRQARRHHDDFVTFVEDQEQQNE